ncbi:unnamed protein product [marine sediment metagenome]|uniref:Uncharacterized protein n=1 Tax=marine sediment metagenome TaxID=412755 RepID=X1BDT4_9ZZZZ
MKQKSYFYKLFGIKNIIIQIFRIQNIIIDSFIFVKLAIRIEYRVKKEKENKLKDKFKE